MGNIFRTFTFMGHVLGMVKSNPKLLSPIAVNLAIAVPVNIVFAVVYGFLGTGDGLGRIIGFTVLAFGLTVLYFIDYFCNGLACSLIFDQVTTGQAHIGPALKRTLKASPRIVIFAASSGMLDLIATYARERNDLVGTILAGIVRAIWTTATYVVMPAMVIEGVGFFSAFKRSKDLMKQDPTQVGVGIVGIGLVTMLLSFVCIGMAYGAAEVLSGIPILAGIAFFTMVNVYWSVSGFARITYYTCFYLWARECERAGRADPALAPWPLAQTVAPVFAGGY